MEIIQKINPVCLALSPFAVALRACHQLPIILKRKRRDLTYNKYTENVLSSDINFANDRWVSFQFIEWRLNNKWCGADEWEKRTNKWSMDNFGIPANCIRYDGTSKSYVEMITRKKPSEVIKNHTHLIVIGSNYVCGFMDHYYCDGHSLTNYFHNIFIEEKLTITTFPKYTYYPFISDAMSIQMISKQMIEMIQYPSQINGISDKTRVMGNKVRKNNEFVWNRWTTYAIGVLPIFESMPSIEYLRVGLTVGFDADQTFGNNRIGMILVRITRPKHNTYNERISDLMDQFKTQAIANYMDAHTMYDIICGYDVEYFRRFGMKQMVDIMFTSLYYKEEFETMIWGIGGFVGSFTDYEFLYINAISHGNTTQFTYVSNLRDMNYTKLVEDGMTIEYEFDNLDTNQF